jgi:hypothetical protein
MLKISGTDGSQTGTGTGTANIGLGLGKGAAKGAGKDGTGMAGLTEGEFQALMVEFDQRMKVLRTVVEAGVEVGRQGGIEGEGAAEEGQDTVTGGEI